MKEQEDEMNYEILLLFNKYLKIMSYPDMILSTLSIIYIISKLKLLDPNNAKEELLKLLENAIEYSEKWIEKNEDLWFEMKEKEL